MARLYGQDSTCEVYNGGPQDGVKNYGAAINLKNLLLSGEVEDGSEVGDSSNLGDLRSKYRVKRANTRVTLRYQIDSAGPILIPVGNYCRVVIKPISVLTPIADVEGVVTGVTFDNPDNPQTITMVVQGDAE